MKQTNNQDLCLTYVFRNGIDTLKEIDVMYEKPFRIAKKRAECKSLTNLFWHIFSGFTYYKYSIIDESSGDEIAYCYISKNLPHFDFIYRFGGGFHIGPDYTFPRYRGRGFHPYLITRVIADILNNNPNTYIYIYVSQSNTASRKGIERTGFCYSGEMIHRDLQYCLIEGTETIPIVHCSSPFWRRFFRFLATCLR